MLEELLVDLVEYGITGGVHLAVDMHRNNPGRMGLDLLEELEKSRGLARARGAPGRGH